MGELKAGRLGRWTFAPHLLCSYASSCAAAAASSCLLMLQHPICALPAPGTRSCLLWAFGCSISCWQQQLSPVFQGLPSCCPRGRGGRRAGTVAGTGKRSELTPKALKHLLEDSGSIKPSAGLSFREIVQTGNERAWSDSISQTAFPMLFERSHVEAFTGFSLAGWWEHMLDQFRWLASQ